MSNLHNNCLSRAEQQFISDVLTLYGITSEWQGKRSEGGMNNSTFVLHTDEEIYIMRQYETHNDQAKIAFEHDVLTALQHSDFKLDSPRPVESVKNQRMYQVVQDEFTGRTKIVTLFHYLEGVNPVWEHADQLLQLGRAAGHLSSSLARLDVQSEPVYPPYYRIDKAYPLCSPSRLMELCASPPEALTACAAQLGQLRDELPDLFEALRGMDQLPHQLVHGDVNASNVLADSEGNICAILDFEFATWDLRVMELAVPMSDMLTMDKSEAWMWKAQARLVQGFREKVELTAQELRAIPPLILLRSLDVVMHFISRMLEGTDKPQVAVEQIVKLKQRMEWMRLNELQLRRLLTE
ncbi:homoserine kinase type II [Paenibacillus sp. JGP012]|uniref:phosphotransferase n=1 Tax=Paenibacillus sp. JGP012 TaxID=2735914 RepID=UPI00161AA906|nr:phosphotransferase [Paenibacillus sp. JGP012]MBB6019276.1 homoserine kinase type II [Paenibacillus sp. JGP012]